MINLPGNVCTFMRCGNDFIAQRAHVPTVTRKFLLLRVLGPMRCQHFAGRHGYQQLEWRQADDKQGLITAVPQNILADSANKSRIPPPR